MALYDLSVCQESPQDCSRGSTRYIVASFLITALKALLAIVHMTWVFRSVFEATEPLALGFQGIVVKHARTWEKYLAVTAVTLGIIIRDAPLVS